MDGYKLALSRLNATVGPKTAGNTELRSPCWFIPRPSRDISPLFVGWLIFLSTRSKIVGLATNCPNMDLPRATWYALVWRGGPLLAGAPADAGPNAHSTFQEEER